VTEHTAAYECGLQVGDVLIAIDKWVISKENLVTQLKHLSIGQTAQLSILRDKKLKQLKFIVTTATSDTVALEVFDQARCNSWLG
jgi:predicted metalloprotease with PDZ domain